MRKILCLLLVVLICGAGSAFADDCAHLYRIDVESGRYDFGWYSIGPAGHVWRDYYWQVCDYCGDVALTYLEDSISRKHSFETTDDWHFEGESVHYYETTCFHCGYVTTYATECSGELCNKISAMQKVNKMVDRE